MPVQVIRPAELGPAELARWRQLQAADPTLASPYLCPEFTLAVGRVRADARVALIEDRGGAILGFLPFQRRPSGVAVPIGGPFNDVQAVIGQAELGQAGADGSLPAWLAGCGLRALAFNDVLAAQPAFQAHHGKVEGSHCIDLAAGYAAYAAERKRAGSQVLPRSEASARKLARAIGPLRFELHTPDQAVFRQVLQWKSDQYRRTRVVDAFRFRWTNALLEDLLGTDRPDFAGVLSALWAGDRLVAAHFGMRSSRIWHYWFPVYDVAEGRFSPGAVLLQQMAEQAHLLGVGLIELGKGDYDFKRRLANHEIPLAEVYVGRPSLASAGRGLRRLVERTCEQLPLGPLGQLPGKAFRRLDSYRVFW